MTYYIIETQYVGGNRDTASLNRHTVQICTMPAAEYGDGQPVTSGWCGEDAGTATFAHGEYQTLDAARDAVEALFEDIGEDACASQDRSVAETYRVGRYTLSQIDTEAYINDALAEPSSETLTAETLLDIAAMIVEAAAGDNLELTGTLAILQRRLAEASSETE